MPRVLVVHPHHGPAQRRRLGRDHLLPLLPVLPVLQRRGGPLRVPVLLLPEQLKRLPPCPPMMSTGLPANDVTDLLISVVFSIAIIACTRRRHDEVIDLSIDAVPGGGSGLGLVPFVFGLLLWLPLPCFLSNRVPYQTFGIQGLCNLIDLSDWFVLCERSRTELKIEKLSSSSMRLILVHVSVAVKA